MRRMFAAACACTTGALLLVARDGRSDTPTSQTVRLSWVRGEEATACPDAQTVMDRVRTGLGRDPFNDRATMAAEVLVERSDEGFVAHMRVRASDGALAGVRTLRSSESCDTLASAVALALALFIDPNAALAPPVPSSLAPAPREPAALPPHADMPPPPPAAPTSRLAPPIPPPEHRAPVARAPKSMVAAAGVIVAPGLLPGAGGGSLLQADVEIGRRWSVGAQAALLPEESTSDAEFAFGMTAMGARGCFDLVSTAVLRVAPCVGVWVGEIHAVVFTTALRALPPGGRLWGSAEATARARLLIVGPIFAEAEAGAFAPFARYGFSVRGQNSPVFQEPVALPMVSLALGVSFP
jgi:hypothetical protein